MNRESGQIKLTRELPAYMTLESSLIMPGIIVLIGIIIYFLMFLYNHVVVYQSCYMAAVRGTQCKAMSDSQVRVFTDIQLNKLLDRQIYEYTSAGDVEVSAASIKCKASTSIINRLVGFGLFREDQLEAEREGKLLRIDPTGLIRNNRPTRGGKDD